MIEHFAVLIGMLKGIREVTFTLFAVMRLLNQYVLLFAQLLYPPIIDSYLVASTFPDINGIEVFHMGTIQLVFHLTMDSCYCTADVSDLQNNVHFVPSIHSTSNTMEPCAKSVSKSDYPFAPSNSPTYLSTITALPTPPQTFAELPSTIL